MKTKETSTQARRRAFLEALPSIGWSGPDRFGHFKADVTHPTSGTVYTFRLKAQQTGWRIERLTIIPATSYSKEEKRWIGVGRWGYFSKTRPEDAHVPAFKQPQPQPQQ